MLLATDMVGVVQSSVLRSEPSITRAGEPCEDERFRYMWAFYCSRSHYSLADVCCQAAPPGEVMPQCFGEKLRYLRRQHKLTQTDLAQQMMVIRQSHIANIEAQRRGPSLQFVILIAGIFHVTTEYLLRDTIPAGDAALYALEEPMQAKLPNAFGAKVRFLRKQLHISQVELAQSLGLDGHSHISFLESGRHEPSVDLIIQLSDIFKVTTDYLLWDSIPIQNALR